MDPIARDTTITAPEDRALPASGAHTPDQTATLDGILVAALELQRRPTRYEPADHVWLFASHDSWSAITLNRTERWSDDGDQEPVAGTATVLIEHLGPLDTVADRIRRRYGESGWTAVLDAGHTNNIELFRRWAPVQVERDLDRASFFRPDLTGSIGAFTPRELEALRDDIEQHLAAAGFEVAVVGQPPRPTRPGENLVLAHAILRRFELDITAIVRIDQAGEIYTRLTEPDDDSGTAQR